MLGSNLSSSIFSLAGKIVEHDLHLREADLLLDLDQFTSNASRSVRSWKNVHFSWLHSRLVLRQPIKIKLASSLFTGANQMHFLFTMSDNPQIQRPKSHR
jgi:hypothetical protein